MKIIKGFKLREVAGEKVVSGEGVGQINFNKLIALNESAAYLWSSLEGKSFDIAQVAELLVSEYEIDLETAQRDASTLIAKWSECGLLEDE